MEITNEIKTKVFSQYLEQNCAVVNDTYIDGGYVGKMLGVCTVRGLLMEHPKGSDGDEKINNCKLILKPISKITDEDAIECAKINTSIKNWTDEDWKDEAKYIKEAILQSKLSVLQMQYLILKGYDLPNYLLGGKTLHESGLAIYEN